MYNGSWPRNAFTSITLIGKSQFDANLRQKSILNWINENVPWYADSGVIYSVNTSKDPKHKALSLLFPEKRNVKYVSKIIIIKW